MTEIPFYSTSTKIIRLLCIWSIDLYILEILEGIVDFTSTGTKLDYSKDFNFAKVENRCGKTAIDWKWKPYHTYAECVLVGSVKLYVVWNTVQSQWNQKHKKERRMNESKKQFSFFPLYIRARLSMRSIFRWAAFNCRERKKKRKRKQTLWDSVYACK